MIAEPCACGCGKIITNLFQACYPVLPWDPPGAEPRAKDERCLAHASKCAYRDDDPDRCPACHGRRNCTCEPAWRAQKGQMTRLQIELAEELRGSRA